MSNEPTQAQRHQMRAEWAAQDSMVAAVEAARNHAWKAKEFAEAARSAAATAQQYHTMVTDKLGPVATGMAAIESATNADRQATDRRLARLESRLTDAYVRAAVIGGVSAVVFGGIAALMFAGRAEPPAQAIAPAPIQVAAPIQYAAPAPAPVPVRVQVRRVAK
jgi:hypothetical protein